jgi:hypothetical protein
MISRRSTLLPLLALALLPLPALPQSQPARYEIEVLIFRNGELSTHLLTPAAPDASMQGEPVAPKRLLDAATRLRAAKGFSVLAHGAWTQAPAAWNSRRGVVADQIGLSAAGLSGTVILERGQYLHLGFDLRYREGDREVTLNEVRRVRVNERNYFDHAGVGVIAIVTAAAANSNP